MTDALHPLARAALWPLRIYLRHSPLHRGKGFLLRNLVRPLLPKGTACFRAILPGGVSVDLRYREALGLTTVVWGPFERAELEYARARVRAGTTAVDVGANVGTFTVVLAKAAPDGRVIAIEPVPENVERLRDHLRQNEIDNVDVVPAVAGETRGTVELFVPVDAAFAGQGAPMQEGGGQESRLSVRCVPLDDVWRGAGSPDVSLVKVDVEGAEPSVLLGATELLRTHRPVLLLEANTPSSLQCLRDILTPLGYRESRPAGFLPWNYVFESERDARR